MVFVVVVVLFCFFQLRDVRTSPVCVITDLLYNRKGKPNGLLELSGAQGLTPGRDRLRDRLFFSCFFLFLFFSFFSSTTSTLQIS